MFNKIFSRGFAHCLYRNLDEVEELHTSDDRMSIEFYDTVYKDATIKLDEIMDAMDRFNKHPEATKLFFMRDEEIMEKFPDMYEFVCSWSFGKNWDDPVELDDVSIEDRNTIDKIGYILSGAFRKNCEIRAFLDDDIMKEINKDVYNRIYTLMQKWILR